MSSRRASGRSYFTASERLLLLFGSVAIHPEGGYPRPDGQCALFVLIANDRQDPRSSRVAVSGIDSACEERAERPTIPTSLAVRKSGYAERALSFNSSTVLMPAAKRGTL